MRQFVLILAALLCACSNNKDETQKHVGYIEADWVYISAPENGWIISRPVTEGSMLTVGDIVFELDKDEQEALINEAVGLVDQADAQARDLASGARPAEIKSLEANRAEAEVQLARAKSDRDRILPLVERGFQSRDKGDEVKANYNIAVAKLEMANEAIKVAKLAGRQAAREAALAARNTAKAAKATAEVRRNRRTVLSKISGHVEEVFHYEGEFVTAGSPIVSILPDKGLKARFFVTQEELPQFELGKKVQVSADGLAAPIQATVSYISHEAEFTPPVIYSVGSRGKLVFLIEARVPVDAGLHSGLPIDVVFHD